MKRKNDEIVNFEGDQCGKYTFIWHGKTFTDYVFVIGKAKYISKFQVNQMTGLNLLPIEKHWTENLSEYISRIDT